jgi:hypothetical protein
LLTRGHVLRDNQTIYKTSIYTIPLDITMSAHRSSYFRPSKIDSLEAEHDYLHVLRERHLQWTSNTNDPEIRRMHSEIVNLIKPLIDRFERLLDALQEQKD